MADLLTKDQVIQEICDLFARNNGGTLQEADIIQDGLDNLLEEYRKIVVDEYRKWTPAETLDDML